MVRPSTPVPQFVDSFIGRAEELQTARTLLAMHRLVTLTGAAGIGKTRLAVRVTEELIASFPDGICFVPFVDVTDPALVPQAVASALGLREQPDRSLLQILTGSLVSSALLLLWDNCDYVVEGCRVLAQALLGSCPHIKILITSSAFTKKWVKRSTTERGGAAMAVFARPLGPEEAEVIQKLVRSRSVPAGIYQRALIILWSTQGLTASEIADRLPRKWDNIVKWIRRFNAEGLAGLQERPGRGRKPQLQETQALTVVETMLTPPP